MFYMYFCVFAHDLCHIKNSVGMPALEIDVETKV